ncbi:MAG: 4Fe-4S binding protein [Desulfobacterales bacterium]|nr:4Fe-4S binding protein [Desulfobacterales bacterium]
MNTKHKIVKEINIDHNVCKGCHLCIDQCPNNVLEVSRNRNTKGYLMPIAAKTDDCIACMLCEMICPDLAISVEGIENEK